MGIPFHYLYIFKNLWNKTYNLERGYEISVEEHTQIDYFFNSCEELISVDDCEPNSLVVFDDCVNIQQQQTIKIILLEDVIKILLACINSLFYESW